MRLFAVGDFHQNEALKDAFLDEVNGNDYDLVIAVGDYEDPAYYEDLVDRVQPRFVALTGNWDFGFEPPENAEYDQLYNYIHVNLLGYKIALLGSVYPDNFQEDVAEFFDDVPHENRIVASHYPPHMLGDLTRMGGRAGFPEFRDLLMKVKPALWLCGHIHEDFGKFSLMQTTVLNCAAKESGNGWDIALGENGVETAEPVSLIDTD